MLDLAQRQHSVCACTGSASAKNPHSTLDVIELAFPGIPGGVRTVWHNYVTASAQRRQGTGNSGSGPDTPRDHKLGIAQHAGSPSCGQLLLEGLYLFLHCPFSGAVSASAPSTRCLHSEDPSWESIAFHHKFLHLELQVT